MVRWYKHKALSKEDIRYARTWLIAFAILNLGNAALTVSEHQAENSVPLSAWGSMAVSVFSVLASAYYQKRLDRARAIAGVMHAPGQDPPARRQGDESSG